MIFIQIVYYLICILAILYCFKRYRISPVTLFLVFQLLMFIGINIVPRAKTENGKLLILFYLIALICYLLGVSFRNVIRTKSDRHFAEYQKQARQTDTFELLNLQNMERIAKQRQWQKIAVNVMVWVSIAACLYFFAAAGTNVFIQAVRDFLSGNNNNLSSDRRGYFDVRGVGYIYQFRAILLPLLTAYIVLATRTNMIRKLCLAALMLVFLLGTGQRNAFVFFAAIVFVYWISLPEEQRLFPRTILIMFIAFCALAMIILTIANGRVRGTSNMLLGAVYSLINRVFVVNQDTAQAAFAYIQTQPTVWGYDWAMMLLDILPGKSGYLSVDRIVYYLAYGTYSGTGPPCLWGSAWYNFSFFGITLFPFLVGYAYQSVYKWYQKKRKDPLMQLIYSALSVYLGIWFYGTPMTLFNNGVVTVLLLYFVLYKIRVKFR